MCSPNTGSAPWATLRSGRGMTTTRSGNANRGNVMSSKSRTRTTSPAAKPASSVRTLRSVPGQAVAATDRTDAEDKLWEALRAIPNSSATDLSVAAKIGKSTAQKILTKWADHGSVTRLAGIAQGGRRAADLWAITSADSTQNAVGSSETSVADDSDVTRVAEAEPDAATVPVPGDSGNTTATENNSTDPADTQLVDTESTVVADEDTPDTVGDVTSVVQAGSVSADTASADGVATDHGQATAKGGADEAGEKSSRLPSGALRGMVEDFLREHPGEEFGPAAIAKALDGRSSGAVSNALDKLVDYGTAVKASDKPRRFASAPSEQAAVPASTS